MDVDLWVSRKSTTAQSEHMPPHGEEPLRSRDLVTLDELMNTSLEHGLDNDKVTARQEVYGNNEVWKGTSWKKLVWQFSIEPAHILIEVNSMTNLILILLADLPGGHRDRCSEP